jgi:hypothetical protein
LDDRLPFGTNRQGVRQSSTLIRSKQAQSNRERFSTHLHCTPQQMILVSICGSYGTILTGLSMPPLVAREAHDAFD